MLICFFYPVVAGLVAPEPITGKTRKWLMHPQLPRRNGVVYGHTDEKNVKLNNHSCFFYKILVKPINVKSILLMSCWLRYTGTRHDLNVATPNVIPVATYVFLKDDISCYTIDTIEVEEYCFFVLPAAWSHMIIATDRDRFWRLSYFDFQIQSDSTIWRDRAFDSLKSCMIVLELSKR